ncbi:hypothetical protein [Pelagicoccus sp. SDUM812003]|uniref:hypothetical protein n=1 Tax=Pelagicoccus sp. SDUM812003 TaxID=3041267 RepID=UPI00280C8546|nr:hypothetical protein [Pelagicoccus sp. SDUM812003]MDQ8205850.1 hypothetical protein [Pelagicoccus sp. SDUM812003]
MIRRKNAVQPIPKNELEELHTGTLLTRLQHLRECEESFEFTDLLPEEIDELRSDGRIHVKDSEEWKEAYSDLKDILSSREHLLNKQERKEERRKRARI